MVIGDRIETAIYGRVTISVIYESEAEARAAGYHSDAHVKGGDWPYTAWKVLYDGERFAAVRVMTDEEAGEIIRFARVGNRD